MERDPDHSPPPRTEAKKTGAIHPLLNAFLVWTGPTVYCNRVYCCSCLVCIVVLVFVYCCTMWTLLFLL